MNFDSACYKLHSVSLQNFYLIIYVRQTLCQFVQTTTTAAMEF